MDLQNMRKHEEYYFQDTKISMNENKTELHN